MKKTVKKLLSYMTVVAMISAMSYNYEISAEETDVVKENIVTSSELGIYGYQIKVTENEDATGDVGFRVICYAPNVGSTISVDGIEYTVAEIGTVYVLDKDCSGVSANKELGEEYTILDEESRTENEGVISYKGENRYNGLDCTYGFIATDEGITTTYDEDDVDNTYYIRTITGMNSLMVNTIQVRPFVVATDGTIIYGEETETLSVAGVASYLYENRKLATKEEHDNVYKYILNSEMLKKIYLNNSEYPYYREKQIEYGWSPLVPV